jgi:YD repeat-containing protein
VDAAGTTAYTYANGLLSTEDGPWASDTVTFSYNTARLRSGLSLSQPGGGTWTNGHAYDAAGRLTQVDSPGGVFAYTYLSNVGGTNVAGSLVTKLTNSSYGPYVANVFDTVGRVTSTRLWSSGGTLLNQHEYACNLAHQRTRATRTNSAGTWNGYVDYTCDVAGELRTARTYNASGGAVAAENYDYGYDAGWNLVKRTNNTSVTTYTVNNLNQATSDGNSLTFDSNGNLTAWSTQSHNYEYDDENQLTKVYVPSSWKTEFVYDGRMRLRVKKEFTWLGAPYNTWSATGETRYVYDGMRVIQERNSSNAPLISYTRGLDLSGSLEGAGGIGGLLARSVHNSSSPYAVTSRAFYHADGNGNVTYLADQNQALAAAYKYDPFGRTIASSGSLASANTYRFSSKELMVNSGLYSYGYRRECPGHS